MNLATDFFFKSLDISKYLETLVQVERQSAQQNKISVQLAGHLLSIL